MLNKLRHFGLRSKAILFTVIIHGALVALLLYSFNWVDQIKRGGVESIRAVVISEQEILEQIEKQRQLEQKKKQESEQTAKNLEKLLEKQQQEKKKLEELARRRKVEEKKQQKLEKKRKQEAERKRKEEEEKKIEAENNRIEAERKRKEEEKIAAEKKKLEAERKRKEEDEEKKLEAERQRKEEEKRQRAEQLREQLEKELRVKTRNDAGDALSALKDQIAAKVEDNWRRPQISEAGLSATIRVKVARDGRVTSVRITKSSGDLYFDQSTENAVRKASPLPFPANPTYYEFINEFDFNFAPDES